MSEIIFDKTFPPLARESVETTVNEFAWIIPAWPQRLYVSFRGDEMDSSAYVTVEKDYRFAHLNICGNWINESEYVQKEHILHELIHLHNAPTKDFALDNFDTLVGTENAKLYAIIKQELTAKNEAATADLAYVLMKKLHPEIELRAGDVIYMK